MDKDVNDKDVTKEDVTEKEVMEKVEIEEELEFHKKVYAFEETMRESIKAVVQIKTVDLKPEIWESKIGGTPYFPKDGMKYPVDTDGNPMMLLTQLNLAEMPINYMLPNEGILQFFVCYDSHEAYEEGVMNENFTVIYHKDVFKDSSLLISENSLLSTKQSDFLDGKELKIEYVTDTEPLSMYDYEFFEFAEFQPEYVAEELWKDKNTFIFRHYLSRGTKLGGYPHYIQELYPAYISECLGINESNALLFQFDSNSIREDDENYAIGNFFINPANLKKLDFSGVKYTVEKFKNII